MARLTCSVRVVQLRTESRLWMGKLEDQLMSASGKLQRGMRWPFKVRKGPEEAIASIEANCCFVRKVGRLGAARKRLKGGASRHSCWQS
jgi:hypothetical protein